MTLAVAVGNHPRGVWRPAGANRMDRPRLQRLRQVAFVAQTLFVLGNNHLLWPFHWALLGPDLRVDASPEVDAAHLLRAQAARVTPSGSTRHPRTDNSGGDRATLGRGIARSHLCQHRRPSFARHARNSGLGSSAVATSVRSGGCGDSASHEAITSAKARSSRSGSASTRAKNSSRAASVGIAMTMTDHTETGWRSSAVAEIT